MKTTQHIGKAGELLVQYKLVKYGIDSAALTTDSGMKKVNPQFVSLSPHDSSDWSIKQFKNAFGDVYHDLKVGTPLVL
ncbi:hypothetical protein [Desulfobacula sp.]